MAINDFYDQYTPVDEEDYLSRFKKYLPVGNSPEVIQSSEVELPKIEIPTRALDGTEQDLSQEHGFSTSPEKAAMVGESDAAMQSMSSPKNLIGGNNPINHTNDTAIELLKKSLGEPIITPEEKTKASILALIPQVGGLLAGALMGKAKLSPHAKFSLQELRAAPTGAMGGLELGAKAGEMLSNQYLAELKSTAERQNKLNEVLAKREFDLADEESTQQNRKELINTEHENRLKEIEAKGQIERGVSELKQNQSPVSDQQKQSYVDMLTKAMSSPKFTDQDKANAADSIFSARNSAELKEAFRTGMAVVTSVQKETNQANKADDANPLVGMKYKDGAAPADWKPKKFAEESNNFLPAINDVKKAREAVSSIGNVVTSENFAEIRDALARVNNALATARGAGSAIPAGESGVKLGDVPRLFANGKVTNYEAALALLRDENFNKGLTQLENSLKETLREKASAYDLEFLPDNPVIQLVPESDDDIDARIARALGRK